MYGQAKPEEDSALKRMLGMLDLIKATMIGQLALSRLDYKPLFGKISAVTFYVLLRNKCPSKDWFSLALKHKRKHKARAQVYPSENTGDSAYACACENQA